MINKYELWKDIPNTDGLYQASNLGRIRSIRLKEIIIKGNYNKSNGYWMTYVKGRKRETHRWIAETWLPKIEGKNQVNHIDGNKLNNRVDNLEWCSPKENIQHALNSGKMNEHIKNMSIRNIGENNPKSKLSETKVVFIREYYEKNSKLTYSEMSKIFGIGRCQIANIIKRRNWKHIK